MSDMALHRQGALARPTARIYLFLFPAPIVCFVGALATDIAYASSAELMWLHFSEWLIATGLAIGALAAVALLVEFFTNRAVRSGPFGRTHLVLFFGTLVVELVNALIHTIDGWTAVVPTGLVLSAVGALLGLAAVGTLFRVGDLATLHQESRA